VCVGGGGLNLDCIPMGMWDLYYVPVDFNVCRSKWFTATILWTNTSAFMIRYLITICKSVGDLQFHYIFYIIAKQNPGGWLECFASLI
jgi:hypothetical protein